MTDDPNQADYWKQKTVNARYGAHGVIDSAVRVLLQ
jgi:hypothetical protein